MDDFLKIYLTYQTWWYEHSDHSEETFEDHVNRMSLYEFMELINSWKED